jgi:hypothetical protein
MATIPKGNSGSKPPAKPMKATPPPPPPEPEEEEEVVEEEQELQEEEGEADVNAGTDFESASDEQVETSIKTLTGRVQAEIARKFSEPPTMGAHEGGVGGWMDELAMPIALVFLTWLRKKFSG